MEHIEEAEIKDNGDVVIRYYFGKTVIIPGEVMKREAIVHYSAEEFLRKVMK